MGGSTQAGLSQESIALSNTQGARLDNAVSGNLRFLSSVLGDKFGSNWNALPSEVRRSFDMVRTDTERAYRNASFSDAEALRYTAKTSGANIGRGQVESAIRSNAFALDQDRRLALGQIQLDEANAGLSANNSLMRLFTGAGQTALGLASTYQSQANQAASMTSSTDPWAGALGGAASGAATGAAFGGVGAPVGAVVGGVLGYLGSR